MRKIPNMDRKKVKRVMGIILLLWIALVIAYFTLPDSMVEGVLACCPHKRNAILLYISETWSEWVHLYHRRFG